MIIVAGPPGSGKSTTFPVSGFGIDFFNADDQAASLNNGSYVDIPLRVREQVNRAFEAFILDRIQRQMSFVFETTLRTAVTFDQATAAKQAGFRVEMRYLALQNFALHLKRVKMRGFKGGHSAPESVLRGIYESSLRNLPRAIREMDSIDVYDNSDWGADPKTLLQAERGEILYQADEIPPWLAVALAQL